MFESVGQQKSRATEELKSEIGNCVHQLTNTIKFNWTVTFNAGQ